ncbi:MAG: S8 family peptidase [Chitinophagaceae bacterium]|nr:S8 family peptidase [Chitinophagaceae bacterium]
MPLCRKCPDFLYRWLVDHTGTGKAAKNNVVVAAVTGFEAMTSYSSFGPVHDGRVKPEISAMGDGVFSTYTPLNSYGTISGTSMATPGITGTVALLAQRYKQLNGNVLPPSTLIKNTVCNTAKDLGNPGPDYKFGFGCISALSAIRILEENRYALNTVGTGGTNDITINVPAGTARLRVMLTWNDPAAAANAALALVNNLDLRVIDPSSTAALPWILNPNSPATNATQADDNISNIEQVTINNPSAGSYTLRVVGEAVTTGPTQDYALTWDVEQPNIEVTYPNGGESLNPGTPTQVISWTNAGVTSTQTVEYSLDNGGTWTTISSTVPASTTRLNWTVPSANTSTAKIRITSGSITDQSDNTFKILGTVTGFSGSGVSCNAGEVTFTWTAVANATHYDIYRLDPATGEFVLLASNIGGSPYTATGLTPNTSMWFTIRSKNTSTSAESERANAINVTTSNGGGGLGAVGPISGVNTICGTQTGVSYSISAVSGATSYIWTAPPGATVASGQGTTSITIDYGAGSSSGNVSAAASNGACSTAPSTLAITVGSSSIAAPTSGGNQSQAVCSGGTIPTLIAAATVPSGYSVVWYTASTGGSVVASPELSAVGNITYYAASKETSTNCESNTRTAVTLTITQVPLPSVSASGATTFCQGQSVTLTASAGSSWSWSNGATTQSITVNTTGNYTVTVVNNGCTNSTPATAVNVNPLPTATVAAGGPVSFCDGSSVTLTASAGSSWIWSNGATTQSVNVGTAGNYSVTITNASGCSATSSATIVSVSPNPNVTISAEPYTSLFPGLQTTLTANVSPSGSYNYTWQNNGATVAGATSTTLAGINLDALGSYTVTVTNASGLPCSKTSDAVIITDSATARLFIYPSPNNGQFTVSYYSASLNDVYTVTVTDSKGALVFRQASTVSSSYQRIAVDIRRQGGGLYLVSLHNKAGNRIATGKVLVQ